MPKLIDITGKKFNYITALEYKGSGKWLFRCDCGNEFVRTKERIVSGETKSCGCGLGKTPTVNIEGMRFGRLVALRPIPNSGKSGGYLKWVFKCDCGREIVRSGKMVRSGYISSCGCLKRDYLRSKNAPTYKHGRSNTPEFHIWSGMIHRCTNPNSKAYKNYGGRGIKVCDRWRNSFENFLADMGERPSKEYSIDRIDVNGNYEPTNCRWVLWEIQCQNKRNTKYFEYQGVKHSLREWCNIYGVKEATVKNRISKNRGYSFEELFSPNSLQKKMFTKEEVRYIRSHPRDYVGCKKYLNKNFSHSLYNDITSGKIYKDIV